MAVQLGLVAERRAFLKNEIRVSVRRQSVEKGTVTTYRVHISATRQIFVHHAVPYWKLNLPKRTWKAIVWQIIRMIRAGRRALYERCDQRRWAPAVMPTPENTHMANAKIIRLERGRRGLGYNFLSFNITTTHWRQLSPIWPWWTYDRHRWGHQRGEWGRESRSARRSSFWISSEFFRISSEFF